MNICDKIKEFFKSLFEDRLFPDTCEVYGCYNPINKHNHGIISNTIKNKTDVTRVCMECITSLGNKIVDNIFSVTANIKK